MKVLGAQLLHRVSVVIDDSTQLTRQQKRLLFQRHKQGIISMFVAHYEMLNKDHNNDSFFYEGTHVGEFRKIRNMDIKLELHSWFHSKYLPMARSKGWLNHW